MAWNISAGAIKNPIPPIVLILALLFAGLTAYLRLPVNQYPGIEFPVFQVGVSQPGAAPAEMETQVAQRVESALTAVQGVRRVTTNISPGYSSTTVQLQIGANLSRAVEDARDAMTRIRPDLPSDITEPQIRRQDFAAQPIAYYALEAPGMSDEERSWFIDNDLSRELLAVQGVSQVSRSGGVDREIRIQLDPEKLTAYGLSADAISRSLRTQNADMPGGQAQIGGQAQSIRTIGSAQSVQQLADMQLTAPDGRVVRLSDLGTVTDSSSDLRTISRYNGEPVVTFRVQRAKNASEITVFDAVQKKLQQIEHAHPGMHFRLFFTSVDFIRGMHESSISALLEGAFLACMVVFLTLRDWRATLIAAAAIPLSIIPTFAAIEAVGFTVNMMTLIAMALVAGVLVDDAIVEIENIVRHMRMGKKPFDAAMEAADEIGLAVVATSATIIAVFVPVGFMGGQIGQWFKEFGLTVAIATFFSLIVARLITPMMAAYFLKDHLPGEPKSDFTEIYRQSLAFSIRHPIMMFVGSIVIFVASLVLPAVGLLQSTFIPRLDEGMVHASIDVPPGATTFEADRAMQQIAARAGRSAPEVENVFTFLNSVDGGATDGELFVTLVDRSKRNRSSFDVSQVMRPQLSTFPDYRVTIANDNGNNDGADITVQMVGSNPAAVNAAADRLAAAMRRLPMLADAHSSSSLQRPELQIRPRPEDEARLGVSATSLASAVRIATSGDVAQNLPRFDLPDRQIPIRVTIRPDARQSLDVIRALPVQSSLGAPVRLDAVADVGFGLGEVSISRRDRERAVTVLANVISGDIGKAQKAVFDLPEVKNLPPGVHLARSGNTEDMAELFSSFLTALGWGVLLVYGVLVLLFRDFWWPLAIFPAMLISLSGAIGALFLANQPLSLFVFIGIIMLVGIVTKNSILLVDFAIEQIHRGMTREQALMEAGMKRARPILMTSFAMAAGMLPAALGWSVDGALRQGMGVAVIGGLMISTALSLILVPSMCVLIDKLENFFARLFGKKQHATQAYPQAAE